MTVTHKLHKKTIKTNNSYEVEILKKRPKGAKNWKKSSKKYLVENETVKSAVEQSSSVETKTYNYLDCCIYTVQNLTEGQLDPEMLPLFATLIGNDFIERRVFSKFFSNVRKRKFSKKISPQQKRILKILDFLKNETFKSAIKKILGHMKIHQRQNLLRYMKSVMSGYSMENSEAFNYFQLADEFPEAVEMDAGFNIDEMLESSEEEESVTSEDSQSEDDYYCDEEVDSLSDKPGTESENREETESETHDELPNKCEDLEEKQNHELNVLKNEIEGSEQAQSSESEISEEKESEDDVEDEGIEFSRGLTFPDWFRKFYSSASVPRFVCDFFAYRRHINYPQVEEFDKPDCNKIAHPIMKMIFSLFHSNDSYLNYYTRIPGKIRYEVKRFEKEEMYEISDFDPTVKRNVKYIKDIFRKYVVNYEKVFERINEIPEVHRLFILAVIFWLNRSHSADTCYLISVLLGMISITTIDKKCEKIHRDQYVFNKNYKKYLDDLKTKKKEEKVEAKEKVIEKLEPKVEVSEKIEIVTENSTEPQETGKRKRRHRKKKNKDIEPGTTPIEAEKIQPSDEPETQTNVETENLSEKMEGSKDVLKLLRLYAKEVTKPEALLAMESLIANYSISPKLERKHADFKRRVVHGFSELQTVIFNLNALNPILNYPYENVKIENYFNGLFLYNIYNSLKSRADPVEYVRKCVFQHSPNLWGYFSTLFEFCTDLLPNLKQETAIDVPKVIKKSVKKKPAKKSIQTDKNDCLADHEDKAESDNEYNDLNNKFSSLLKI